LLFNKKAKVIKKRIYNRIVQYNFEKGENHLPECLLQSLDYQEQLRIKRNVGSKATNQMLIQFKQNDVSFF
jgi:hypothetical protein